MWRMKASGMYRVWPTNIRLGEIQYILQAPRVALAAFPFLISFMVSKIEWPLFAWGSYLLYIRLTRFQGKLNSLEDFIYRPVCGRLFEAG